MSSGTAPQAARTGAGRGLRSRVQRPWRRCDEIASPQHRCLGLVLVVARRLRAGDDAGKVALFAGFARRPTARLGRALGAALHLLLLVLAAFFFLTSLVERRTSSVCQGVTSFRGQCPYNNRSTLEENFKGGPAIDEIEQPGSNRRRPAWEGRMAGSAISAEIMIIPVFSTS